MEVLVIAAPRGTSGFGQSKVRMIEALRRAEEVYDGLEATASELIPQ
jgi:hypothetical protein